MRYFDICIIGGGHTGLVATLAFANKKLNVLCVEKKSFKKIISVIWNCEPPLILCRQ